MSPNNAKTDPRARLSRFVCIDFEASALGPKSYPTEIGLADPVTGDVWSCLIKPHPTWIAEGEWNPAGEAVTGITRAMLAAQGADPWGVYADVRRLIAGREVVSDSPSYDGRWFCALAAAALNDTARAGEQPPPLLDLAVVTWQLAATAGRDPGIAWRKAEAETYARFPRPHRAGPDARYNAEILRQVVGCAR